MTRDSLKLNSCKPMKGARVVIKQYSGTIGDKRASLLVESTRGCDRYHLEIGFNRYVAVVVDGCLKRSTMTQELYSKIVQLI